MRLSAALTFTHSVGCALIFGLLLLPASASAETLTGTVHNGTTRKPAAGDHVVLIRLGQGMEEAARTRTDAGGHFTFHLPDAGPHLIRAIHQDVTYYSMVQPGTTSVEVTVFDVSHKIDGISVTADVMRFQAQGNELQGTRLFAVNNASNPPRTEMNGKAFEFFLPAGAQIDQAIAMTAGGQPVNSSPVPAKEKSRYGFVFPLRPGETEFQVAFHLRYGGELSIDPKTLYGAQHFVVMVPKAMQFTAAPGVTFQSMEDPRQSDAKVQVVANTRAGQPLGFAISGTGALHDPGDDSQGAPHLLADQTATPAGGGPTHGEAPDPIKRYRWYALAGFGLLLGTGAAYFAKRSGASRQPAADRPASARVDRSDVNLEKLKDKMFQLEVQHQQGRISGQDYERARAVLDRSLDRAIKRKPRKRA